MDVKVGELVCLGVRSVPNDFAIFRSLLQIKFS